MFLNCLNTVSQTELLHKFSVRLHFVVMNSIDNDIVDTKNQTIVDMDYSCGKIGKHQTVIKFKYSKILSSSDYQMVVLCIKLYIIFRSKTKNNEWGSQIF